jgi:hypothetical protein
LANISSDPETQELPLEDERSELDELEKRIERGFRRDWREAGEALREVHDSKLYLGEFPSFAAHVEARFEVHRTTAYDYMNAAEVAAEVSARADIQLLQRHAELLYRSKDSDTRVNLARRIAMLSAREAAAVVRDAERPEGPPSASTRGLVHERDPAIAAVADVARACLDLDAVDVARALETLEPEASDKLRQELARAARRLRTLAERP